MNNVKRIRIILAKSLIGRKKKHQLTANALGLRKTYQMVEHDFTPAIQGMINKINYLLKIEEVS